MKNRIFWDLVFFVVLRVFRWVDFGRERLVRLGLRIGSGEPFL
jgi:hypothetical protein